MSTRSRRSDLRQEQAQEQDKAFRERIHQEELAVAATKKRAREEKAAKQGDPQPPEVEVAAADMLTLLADAQAPSAGHDEAVTHSAAAAAAACPTQTTYALGAKGVGWVVTPCECEAERGGNVECRACYPVLKTADLKVGDDGLVPKRARCAPDKFNM